MDPEELQKLMAGNAEGLIEDIRQGMKLAISKKFDFPVEEIDGFLEYLRQEKAVEQVATVMQDPVVVTESASFLSNVFSYAADPRFFIPVAIFVSGYFAYRYYFRAKPQPKATTRRQRIAQAIQRRRRPTLWGKFQSFWGSAYRFTSEKIFRPLGNLFSHRNEAPAPEVPIEETPIAESQNITPPSETTIRRRRRRRSRKKSKRTALPPSTPSTPPLPEAKSEISITQSERPKSPSVESTTPLTSFNSVSHQLEEASSSSSVSNQFSVIPVRQSRSIPAVVDAIFEYIARFFPAEMPAFIFGDLVLEIITNRNVELDYVELVLPLGFERWAADFRNVADVTSGPQFIVKNHGISALEQTSLIISFRTFFNDRPMIDDCLLDTEQVYIGKDQQFYAPSPTILAEVKEDPFLLRRQPENYHPSIFIRKPISQIRFARRAAKFGLAGDARIKTLLSSRNNINWVTLNRDEFIVELIAAFRSSRAQENLTLIFESKLFASIFWGFHESSSIYKNWVYQQIEAKRNIGIAEIAVYLIFPRIVRHIVSLHLSIITDEEIKNIIAKEFSIFSGVGSELNDNRLDEFFGQVHWGYVDLQSPEGKIFQQVAFYFGEGHARRKIEEIQLKPPQSQQQFGF